MSEDFGPYVWLASLVIAALLLWGTFRSGGKD
jgi:hypothetical protein